MANRYGQFCPIAKATEILGEKWTLLIVRELLMGASRFSELATEPCKQLLPILLALGRWGMEWTRDHLQDNDYDVELLMLYLERSIRADKLPGAKAVIRFHFTDFDEMTNWWIVVDGDAVDVCTSDPGRDVDIYINTTVRTMTETWMGRNTYRQAKAAGTFEVHGPAALTRNLGVWLSDCVFADLPTPSEILGQHTDNRGGGGEPAL